MTWSPYHRHVKAKPWRGICAALHKSGNACFTFRAAPDDEFPDWFKPGHKCDVLIGTNEHANMVRFVPGLGVPIKHTATHTNPLIVVLGFRAPGCGVVSTPCEYEYHDDWFDVTLPETWLVRPPADTREIGKRLMALDVVGGAASLRAPDGKFRMIDRLRG